VGGDVLYGAVADVQAVVQDKLNEVRAAPLDHLYARGGRGRRNNHADR